MKRVIRLLSFGFVVYLILGILISIFKVSFQPTGSCDEWDEYFEYNQDILHHRNWMDSQRQFYCLNYPSEQAIFEKAASFRNQISVDETTYKNYWSHVYRELVIHDSSHIKFLADSLLEIGINKGLDQQELAELCVAFVQDIPYQFVIGQPCDSIETEGYNCVGNQRFGILSPYEFIHTLSGDCDTRSILLFGILREIGFDPVIVISNAYLHAMIGINLPLVGDHLTFMGKKYFFWETTSKNWLPGFLPPEFGKIENWEIVLTNYDLI